MADPTFAFLPWVRARAGAAVTSRDTGGQLPARAEFAVGVHLNEGVVAAATVSLQLAGPADVTGIDPRHVVRRVPAPDSSDFEPNLFCLIEFDRAELPWIASPVGPDRTTERLRPWIVLAVVEDRGDVGLTYQQPLPVLRLGPTAVDRELPDLVESWAWGHAQVLTGEDEDPVEVVAAGATTSVSRLICPRRLDPGRHYLACVVPAFDIGALRGLATPEAEIGSVARPAWERGGDTDVVLPVYLHWRFTTGPAGDFEALARRLAVRELPDTLGRRTLFLGAGGDGLPVLAGDAAITELGGALIPAGRPLADIDPGTAARLATALEATTSGDQAAADDVIQAPRYGAAVVETAGAGDPPDWYRQLNFDPRPRSAAGIGGRAVRQHQEALVFGAWAQAGQLQEANERLTGLGLSASVAGSLHQRHFSVLTPSSSLQAHGAALRRVPHADANAAKLVDASPIPDEFVRADYRRAVSMAARRVQTLDRSRPIAEALNDMRVRPEPAPLAPDGAVDSVVRATLPSDATGPVQFAGTGISIPAATARALKRLPPGRADIAVDPVALSGQPFPATFRLVSEVAVLGRIASGLTDVSGIVVEHGGTPVIVDAGTKVVEGDGTRVVLGGNFTLPRRDVLGGSVTLVRGERPRTPAPPPPDRSAPHLPRPVPVDVVLPPRPPGRPPRPTTVRRVREIDAGTLRTLLATPDAELVVTGPGERVRLDTPSRAFVERFVVPAIDVQLPGGTDVVAPDAAATARIHAAMIAHFNDAHSRPDGETVATPVDVAALAAAIRHAADPVRWSAARTAVTIIAGSAIGSAGVGQRVRGYPEVARPAAELVAAVDPDLLLPGVAGLPADSVSLFETDTAFAQAVLAGCNHEFGRELMWRDFPFDPTATPFRRFWRRSTPGADVPEMGSWRGDLGQAFDLDGDRQQVVLVVRSGLVQRYPGTIFTLTDAIWGASGKRLFADDLTPEAPLFAGRLDPDVLYVGFDRLLPEVLGDDDPSGSPGMFFVIEQPPGEPAFGLDADTTPQDEPPANWQQLCWGHMPGLFAEVGAFGGPLTRDGLTWGATSADHAAITLQDPVRVAIHARDLFMPEQP